MGDNDWEDNRLMIFEKLDNIAVDVNELKSLIETMHELEKRLAALETKVTIIFSVLGASIAPLLHVVLTKLIH